LKNEDHGSGKLLSHGRENRRDAKNRGDVNVVTASVSDADWLAVVLAVDRGLERQVGVFGNGQRVQFRAHGDNWTRASALQDADDAGVRDSGLYFEPQPAETFRDELRSLEFPVRKLWVLVNLMAHLDHGRSRAIDSVADCLAGNFLGVLRRSKQKAQS